MTTTPFYKKALDLFTSTQARQIEKGIQKYPEPFNPFSWTPTELLNHALEETVDLTHYLVGLKELLDGKDHEIKQLKKKIQKLTYELSKEEYENRPVYKIVNGKITPQLKENIEVRYSGPLYFDQDDQH